MMTGSEDPTWQQVLDGLTKKAAKDGLLRSIKNAKSAEEKIGKIFDNLVVRHKLSTWISKCLEFQHAKSGGTATRLRDEGNAKFRARDMDSCLRLYTESIICSPEYGPELSLAFGNRSAALYHSGLYEECLRDIVLAIKYRYPKSLVYKLYQRRGLCHTKLGDIEQALKAFDEAVTMLDFISKVTADKKNLMTRDIKALVAEAESSGRLAGSPSRPASPVLPPTIPIGGDNPALPGGSANLSVQTTAAKGRHVIAEKPLKVGDVLFTELPYASILLPEQYASHCHHCYTTLAAPVPCLKCTQPRYCSETCRSDSWSGYHQFECGGLDLLHSVGIAHLGLRLVLVTGASRLLRLRPALAKAAGGIVMEGSEDAYLRVDRLVHHLEDLPAEDQFQYAVTAVLLGLYMDQRTKFLSGCDVDLAGLSLDNASSKKEDVMVFVCSQMLRHVAQLVCNGHAIFEVGGDQNVSASSMSADVSDVQPLRQYRVATAIYPSASMMNHACDPSVISSFHGRRMIVCSVRPTPAGSEVFNCYGPHFRRHGRAERSEVLRSQYHFACTCRPCRQTTDFLDRFSALRCHFCGGPITNPAGEAAMGHRLPCLDCGKVQEYSDRIEQVFVAYDLYKKGMEALEFGNMSDALPALQSCYQMRVKAMYDHHREVTEVADQLAKCYAMMGSFNESAQYLKVCLPAVQERFGANSVEVGHELDKYVNVVLAELQDSACRRSSQFAEKLAEAVSCLEQASEIFRLSYGAWHPATKDIGQKLAKINILSKPA